MVFLCFPQRKFTCNDSEIAKRTLGLLNSNFIKNYIKIDLKKSFRLQFKLKFVTLSTKPLLIIVAAEIKLLQKIDADDLLPNRSIKKYKKNMI